MNENEQHIMGFPFDFPFWNSRGFGICLFVFESFGAIDWNDGISLVISIGFGWFEFEVIQFGSIGQRSLFVAGQKERLRLNGALFYWADVNFVGSGGMRMSRSGLS